MTETRVADGAIEVLASTPATLRALLGGLPEDAVSAKGQEGWSAKDVLAHLASLEQPAMRDRVGLLAAGGDPQVPNIDEDATLRDFALRDASVATLLEEFAKGRAESVVWLRTLTPEQMANSGVHGYAGRITAAEQVNHFAYHDLAHTRQICNLLIPWFDRMRGAMGEAFPDSGY